MFFESHAHYDDRRFDGDRDEVLAGLKAAGVDTVVHASDTVASSRRGLALAEEYGFIYVAVGVHPHNASRMKDGDIDLLRRLAGHKKAVAIGEIGLDFHYDNSPRDVQQKRFGEQLALSLETGLPVIIHSREADRLTFDMIKESGVRRGVIHCYSGSADMAAEYVRLGFHIGVGGVVTYPSARRLVETVRAVPMSAILIETDCPYLSPEPMRGRRNDSSNLVYINKKIAEIKGTSPEEVAGITKENAERLFEI